MVRMLILAQGSERDLNRNSVVLVMVMMTWFQSGMCTLNGKVEPCATISPGSRTTLYLTRINAVSMPSVHHMSLHTLVRCEGSDVLKHVGEHIFSGRRDQQENPEPNSRTCLCKLCVRGPWPRR